jgi:hypothetical protein
MAETRMFIKREGISADSIGRHVAGFLQQQRFQVQCGAAGTSGFVVQARTEDGWKKISGTANAIEVQISDTADAFLVNIGNAQWSDKIGAGVLGAFVFAPLAVTAIVGTVSQKKLPKQIFTEIEKFIACGGISMYMGQDFTKVAEGKQQCPHCKSEVNIGSAFCDKCGGALTIKCRSCGASVPIGTAFCPSCGTSMTAKQMIVCKSCNTENPEGSVFCCGCGQKLE